MLPTFLGVAHYPFSRLMYNPVAVSWATQTTAHPSWIAPVALVTRNRFRFGHGAARLAPANMEEK